MSRAFTEKVQVLLQISKSTKDKINDMARWESRSFSGQVSHLLKVAINDYYEEAKQWMEDEEGVIYEEI